MQAPEVNDVIEYNSNYERIYLEIKKILGQIFK